MNKHTTTNATTAASAPNGDKHNTKKKNKEKEKKDVLTFLAQCPDRTLFAIIVASRLVYLAYVLACTHIFPRLLNSSSIGGSSSRQDFFLFDSGKYLYDDSRLGGLRNWDSVHFFHIAKYGYTHENLYVFFPLVPAAIRAVSFLTQTAFPLLDRVAPVAAYLCLLNIAAAGATGVVLRRLSTMTILGPEAHDLVTYHNCHEAGGMRLHATDGEKNGNSNNKMNQSKCNTDKTSERNEKQQEEEEAPCARLWAAAQHRVDHCQLHTMLDSCHGLCGRYRRPIPAETSSSPPSSSTNGNGSGNGRPHDNDGVGGMAAVPGMATTCILWKRVGAVALLWMVSPTLIFSIAVYTESAFCLLTFTGIYLLARYPAAADDKGHARVYPFPTANSNNIRNSNGEEVTWEQAWTSKDELLAALCFTAAAFARSNAFVCVAFVAYPSFVRLCCRDLYQSRWSCYHGHYYQQHQQDNNGEDKDDDGDGSNGVSVGIGMTSHSRKRVIRTLHPPCGRLPAPARLLVLVLLAACITVPYAVLNYRGWRTFVPMWPAEEQAAIGGRFWTFYGALQKKYWNVGFLTAYTPPNLPNVAISAPIAFLLVHMLCRCYFRQVGRAVRRGHCDGITSDGGGKVQSQQLKRPSPPSLSQRAMAGLQSSACSANMVYLVALALIAFTLMHVQVANRFLMTVPAVYWLMADQLVLHPRSRLTRAILIYSIVWALVGGLLFPNHLPWT